MHKFKPGFPMYTEYLTLFHPPCFFVPAEFPYTVLMDEFKVLDHAHTVFCAVASVEVLQALAGVFFTFPGTKFPIVVTEYLAILYNAFAAIGCFCIDHFSLFTATGAGVLLPQVSDAQGAVHSAGSDQVRIHISGIAVLYCYCKDYGAIKIGIQDLKTKCI